MENKSRNVPLPHYKYGWLCIGLNIRHGQFSYFYGFSEIMIEWNLIEMEISCH